jgi:hypothetical protein
MLGLEDARMLGQMLRRNSPLQILNLSQNQLDANCAALIGDALIYNSNLRVLDLHDNRLGDFGLYLIMAPLIRKQLQDNQINNNKVPVFSPQQIQTLKYPSTCEDRELKALTVLTNVEVVDVKNNITTE